MITIEQLLDSVDLDFEPRWVTKDKDGTVSIWETKPVRCDDFYRVDVDNNAGEVEMCPKLKLAEFDGKDWTECIYEVPRKTNKYELFLKKLGQEESDLVYRVNLPRKTTGKIEKIDLSMPNNKMLTDLELIEIKINELVDAVNELKGM